MLWANVGDRVAVVWVVAVSRLRLWWLVVMVVALGTMDMGGLRRRRGQLSGEHNPARLVLFGQMFGNLGVESFDVADHPVQKPARLKVLAGKFGQ